MTAGSLGSAARPRALVVLRAALFAIAVATAAIVSYTIARRIPRGLQTQTDIIGYPTFHDFNPDRVLQPYLLTVVLFPALAVAIYALGARVLGVRSRASLRLDPPLAPVGHPGATVPTALAWALLTGGCLGMEGAVILHESIASPWVTLLGITAGYAALIYGAGRGLARARSLPVAEAMSAVLALTSPLIVLGLYGLSRVTRVSVRADNSHVSYPWMPWWLAVAVTAALLGLVVRRLSRPGAEPAVVARATVLYLAAPLLVILTFMGIPGTLGPLSVFEEGQGLAGAALTLDGALPWKDLLTIHGLFEDVLSKMLGLVLIEDSRWGAIAGLELVWIPLYWYCNYLLFVRLFRRSWLTLAIVSILTAATTSFAFQAFFGSPVPTPGLFFSTNLRLLLFPVIVLLLARLLDRPSWARAISMTGVLLLQFIVTPETAFLVAAIIVVLPAFEWLHRAPTASWSRIFSRTIRCAVAGSVGLGSFVLYLLLTGSLGGYLDFFGTFVSGHNFTGAIPVAPERSVFTFVQVTMIVLVLAATWYVVAHIRIRRSMSTDDWAMATLALTVLAYYTKFLGRADTPHLVQVWAIAIPLFYYEADRALSALSHWLRDLGAPESRTAHRLAQLPFAITLVVVLGLVGSTVMDRVATTPERFAPTATAEVMLKKEGFVTKGWSLAPVVHDLRRALPRDAAVFDFTNSPSIFYYLLGLDSPTRYYHVSMAIPRASQQDLVRELEAERPEIVVYDQNQNDLGGPSWDDISNPVRHYDVSAYLLDHYRPYSTVDGYSIMVRKDLSVPRPAGVTLDPASFSPRPCAWGSSPAFFSVEPARDAARSAPLRSTPIDTSSEQLELPRDAGSYRWLELEIGAQRTRSPFDVTINGDAARRISFVAQPGDKATYRVMLANCPQWRTGDLGSMTLASPHLDDVGSVRLVR